MLETRLFYEDNRSAVKVELNGSLDTITSPGFDEKVMPVLGESYKIIVLDMRHLDYISSAGVRSVFKLAKGAKAKGIRVAAANRQPQIIKVFDIIKALPDMQVFANEKEMDEYLDAMQKSV